MESNNNIHSLLQLLDDTDSLVYKEVESAILDIGYNIAGAEVKLLEASTTNGLVKERCNSLYNKLRYLHYANELKTWAFINEGDSWEFMYLLSEYCDPAFKKTETIELLHKYEDLFWSHIENENTPEENVKYLKDFIFQKFEFTFNSESLDISSLLLSRFYETKKGSAFLFCMLYCTLAQKKHLPIYVVSFPANLVLVYATKENPTTQDDILFYINPANGEIFSKNGINLFLEKYKLENKIQYFLPCSTFEVCVFYLHTLKEAYLAIGQKKKALEMQIFAQIILDTLKLRSNYE